LVKFEDPVWFGFGADALYDLHDNIHIIIILKKYNPILVEHIPESGLEGAAVGD